MVIPQNRWFLEKIPATNGWFRGTTWYLHFNKPHQTAIYLHQTTTVKHQQLEAPFPRPLRWSHVLLLAGDLVRVMILVRRWDEFLILMYAWFFFFKKKTYSRKNGPRSPMKTYILRPLSDSIENIKRRKRRRETRERVKLETSLHVAVFQIPTPPHKLFDSKSIDNRTTIISSP